MLQQRWLTKSVEPDKGADWSGSTLFSCQQNEHIMPAEFKFRTVSIIGLV